MTFGQLVGIEIMGIRFMIECIFVLTFLYNGSKLDDGDGGPRKRHFGTFKSKQAHDQTCQGSIPVSQFDNSLDSYGVF